jgi:hypothetical protein
MWSQIEVTVLCVNFSDAIKRQVQAIYEYQLWQVCWSPTHSIALTLTFEGAVFILIASLRLRTVGLCVGSTWT